MKEVKPRRPQFFKPVVSSSFFLSITNHNMFTEKILPITGRKDLSKIKHIINNDIIYVDFTSYLKCLDALEKAELLLKEVKKDGWSVENIKLVDSTSLTTNQSYLPVD